MHRVRPSSRTPPPTHQSRTARSASSGRGRAAPSAGGCATQRPKATACTRRGGGGGGRGLGGRRPRAGGARRPCMSWPAGGGLPRPAGLLWPARPVFVAASIASRGLPGRAPMAGPAPHRPPDRQVIICGRRSKGRPGEGGHRARQGVHMGPGPRRRACAGAPLQHGRRAGFTCAGAAGRHRVNATGAAGGATKRAARAPWAAAPAPGSSPGVTYSDGPKKMKDTSAAQISS
jgi:hypothetical protein